MPRICLYDGKVGAVRDEADTGRNVPAFDGGDAGNAILLPTIMEYNADATGEKYRDIARAMGVEGTETMSQEEYRKAAVDAVKKLSQDVGIPADLKQIVKEEDVQFLAESAVADACAPGNPKDAGLEDIIALYKALM